MQLRYPPVDLILAATLGCVNRFKLAHHITSGTLVSKCQARDAGFVKRLLPVARRVVQGAVACTATTIGGKMVHDGPRSRCFLVTTGTFCCSVLYCNDRSLRR